MNRRGFFGAVAALGVSPALAELPPHLNWKIVKAGRTRYLTKILPWLPAKAGLSFSNRDYQQFSVKRTINLTWRND